MKYNRALDYTALAMNELRKGNHELAARLMATAQQQPDFEKGIAILEASNKAAFKMEAAAKQRLIATAEDDEEGVEEDQYEGKEDADAPVEADAVDGDPLDEVEDEVEEEKPSAPAQAMASVLRRMVKKAR
jgi:hypothetical protein